MHTLLDLRGPIPTFIEVSDGKMADVKILDTIEPRRGRVPRKMSRIF
jgi:hypothetical protein